MAIKNADGSTYSFSQPPTTMEEQSFWDKKERVVLHNKFGEKHFREELEEEVEKPVVREVKITNLAEVQKQKEDQIKIVQALEDSKPAKPISADIVNVWCLPCLSYDENVDPLYDESYAKVTYGDKFVFQSKLLVLEDLYLQFATTLSTKIPAESVIFPQTKSRRWWRVKGMEEVKGFNVYVAVVSDYQPKFVEGSD